MMREHPFVARFSHVAAPMPRSSTPISFMPRIKMKSIPLEAPVTIATFPSSVLKLLPVPRFVDDVRICSGRDMAGKVVTSNFFGYIEWLIRRDIDVPGDSNGFSVG